jgi:hypothetical protein
MFIGHFAAGMMAKKAEPRLGLGTLFVACQLPDLIWPVLVLAGVERVSVDPSATAVTPLDFSYYPWSHSLVMTLVYALAFGVGVRMWMGSRRAGVVAGAVVASHWILDWLSHRPDLPLVLGEPKFGLELWRSLPLTLAVEGGLFAVAVFVYLMARPLHEGERRWPFWSMIAFLLLVYAANVFGPRPPVDLAPAAIAGPAFAIWLIVAWGWWADRDSASRRLDPRKVDSGQS